MPVVLQARAMARWKRSSSGEMKLRSGPNSPMQPGLMPVSPTPSRISVMSSSAIDRTERCSSRSSGGTKSPVYQPLPITMCSPVRRDSPASRSGRRPIDAGVSSTMQLPPKAWKAAISSTRTSSSSSMYELWPAYSQDWV
jgi:hypothetical protein